MEYKIEDNRNSFARVAMNKDHINWEDSIKRLCPDKKKGNEIRSEFDRDCGRILHSLAYSRLKAKTQVFYHTHDDRICTRIEHVNHVISVSSTIARFLDLNTELTYAIAMGHDLGHAPFGHKGENILSDICKENCIGEFWHEQNSLKVVDALELLHSEDGSYRNLNLTYAVRDGIISHCGEVNQKKLTPRESAIDLFEFSKTQRFEPFTWEGCVVKLSDKIAYLGRDLEDAQRLGILNKDQMSELEKDVAQIFDISIVNNTNLIHAFITDVCKNSSPEEGIKLSSEAFSLMTLVMRFNYKNIYSHSRLQKYDDYARLVLYSIFDVLSHLHNNETTLSNIKEVSKIYPKLSKDFSTWIGNYTCLQEREPIYNLQKQEDYFRSIVDFLSLLTDRAAIEYFEELTSF